MDDPKSEVRFHWLPSEMPNNINWKELRTPEHGLRAVARQCNGALQQELERDVREDSTAVDFFKITPIVDNSEPAQKDRNVFYRSCINGQLDNTAACSYINKMGGPIPHLSLIAERLWLWLLDIGSWTTARHLAGILNVRADVASRWRDDRSEWRLSEEAFAIVEDLFGPHTIDLMASRRNTQLARFFSRWLDPAAAATDALIRPWAGEGNCYCHPPIVMIPKVLAKLKLERCELTLVAPVWATQPWITDLLDMSVATPRLLLCQNLMEAVLPTKFETKQPGWTTAVWRLSGDASKTKVTAERLRAVLWPSSPTPTGGATS